ncbi:hypothetical protein FCJ61_15420 [Burkholderia metallica]|uniref:hypothetical protein n=1 Tax=Burkholderia metallica TaxID=488729 RepID=UPI00157B4608|nr:hypothetical protein [Burkholderia metallica]NTZ84348.1 hypothetical protein [Burkholderia metallica]
MRKVALLASLLALAPSVDAATKATNAQIDEITLAYLNAKVYRQGAVVCTPAVVGERSYIGCANRSFNGNSALGLWLLDQSVSPVRFLALNGTARDLYQKHLSSNSRFGQTPLPIPGDISIDAALKAVQ